jgi:hypothetical protein
MTTLRLSWATPRPGRPLPPSPRPVRPRVATVTRRVQWSLPPLRRTRGARPPRAAWRSAPCTRLRGGPAVRRQGAQARARAALPKGGVSRRAQLLLSLCAVVVVALFCLFCSCCLLLPSVVLRVGVCGLLLFLSLCSPLLFLSLFLLSCRVSPVVLCVFAAVAFCRPCCCAAGGSVRGAPAPGAAPRLHDDG